MEYKKLPEEYWGKQDYLLYAYDVLADMLLQADSKKLSNISFKCKDIKLAKSFKQSEDILEWLDENGYHDESLKFFSSHVFFLLLRDFCYYIYESIDCAQRAKVTVAYTLLRKPLRDNLLYMEWLLSDAEEFYQKLLYGSIEDYDVSNKNIFNMERIKEIIKKASMKSYMGEAVNYLDLVYTFRFNAEDKIGLQSIWNQSIHLVTQDPKYKTEKSNLNFIFADKEIWDDYWNYYYIAVPPIMAYALDICEALFLNTTEVDLPNLLLNQCVRHAKYSDTLPDIDSSETLKKTFKNMLYEFYEIIKTSDVGFGFKCSKCKKYIILTLDVLNQMVNTWFIRCPFCHETHNICRYYTDYKFIGSGKNNLYKFKEK